MSEENTQKKGPGRPAGSRNKSTLMKAQVKIDDLTLDAVDHLEALMKNDKKLLDCKDDVPYSIRFNATKEILAKGIANEKSKEEIKPLANPAASGDGETVHSGPRVYATAK